MKNDFAEPADPLAWWREARFGMSLHFGLYSVAARGEWVRSAEELTVDDYQVYFDTFCPAPGWADEWAHMAKAAGARHAVLTTKHHDGFCLFDSTLTKYTSMHSAAGRDLVREWVEAVRKVGLKVGLYYSLVDWHHPDYPAANDRQHPLRNHPDAPKRDAQCEWSRYVAYLHGQVEELCRDYGRIDSLIFDFSYGPYRGEKWGASELVRKIRALQPHILLNDRLDREPRKMVPRPDYAGDYDQTEQNIPRETVRDAAERPMPWEGWFTMTNSWCYNPIDSAWKSPAAIIRALVNCVSKDGNLLLNVSPDGAGRIPVRAHAILAEVGNWLELNGESIYGAGAADFPKPEWGRYTRRGKYLYAHVLEPVIGHICLPTLKGVVGRGRLLRDHSEVFLSGFWNPEVQTFDGPDDVFFNFAKPIAHTFPQEGACHPVVRFEMEANANIETTQPKTFSGGPFEEKTI